MYLYRLFIGCFGPNIEKLKSKKNAKKLVKALHSRYSELLQSDYGYFRYNEAINALIDIYHLSDSDKSNVIQNLLSALKSKDDNTRQKVIITLKKIKDIKALPMIIDTFHNDISIDVNIDAAKALGCFNARESLNALIEEFNDKIEYSSPKYSIWDDRLIAIVESLAKFNDSSIIKQLTTALQIKDVHVKVKIVIAKTLSSFQDNDNIILNSIAESYSIDYMYMYYSPQLENILENIISRKSSDQLKKIINDEHGHKLLRSLCTKRLAEMGNTEAINMLENITKDWSNELSIWFKETFETSFYESACCKRNWDYVATDQFEKILILSCDSCQFMTQPSIKDQAWNRLCEIIPEAKTNKIIYTNFFVTKL